MQFTPDLMPTDVIRTNVFDPSSGSSRLVNGPVFTQILVADEVNRTPKTQSALLEAMQKRQVTIEHDPRAGARLFFVIGMESHVKTTCIAFSCSRRSLS